MIFYFVQVLTYTLIAFVLSILIKRAGLAIGLYLLYLLVEQILVGIFRGYLLKYRELHIRIGEPDRHHDNLAVR